MTQPSADYFVAPEGQDAWSGRLPEPNAAGTDGPWATLARAQAAVRGRKERTAPVTVLLRGGTYFLTEPVIFTAEDSGSAEAPVTYAAYPGEQPRLSGGFPVTGWQPDTVNGRPGWSAPAPESCFRQLWVNDQRRERPRLPKTGFGNFAGSPGLVPEAKYNAGRKRFLVNPGEAQNWKNLTDIELVAFMLWAESRMPLAAVDVKKNLLRTSLRSIFRPYDDRTTERFARYYLENVGEALEAPGEWYLDRAAGRVEYLPLPGETPEGCEIIAPRLSQVLLLRGDPEAGAWIEHLHFHGLTFAHTEWRKPVDQPFFGARKKTDDRAGDSQAAISVPGAVAAVGARFCRFDHCTFAHLGTYGLDLGRGCWGNAVSYCRLHDLGAGGIKLGTRQVADGPTSGFNTVSDCDLGPGGLVFFSAIGVWVGQSPYNTVEHNHIHDFYYSGISVGWTWGYAQSGARSNEFAYNHIHDLGKGLLSDMGGIYTLGISPGTTIHHNLIHDVTSHDYGGWGLYHDEGSSNIVSEFNLVYRNKCDAFHQHYGRENLLRNNIFAGSREFLVTRTREEEHISFMLEGNVMYVTGEGLLGTAWTNEHFYLRRNLYWDGLERPLTFAGASWEAWRARGHDVDSVIADPQFADPDHENFTLTADSPAYTEIGFEPFDLSTVGPRGEVGA
jgi:hypothetical protein